MADSRLAFDIIARGGSSAAAEFEKVARGADNAGSAMKKNQAISDAVAKATANLTKAHNAESTALDRVQIAEQKLTEVRSNSNAKVSQTLAGEKALAKARRDAAVAGNVAQKAAKDLAKILDEEGKKGGKGFLGGLKSVPAALGKWFANIGSDGESIFKQAGQNAGNGFFGALTGVLKTPVLGPALLIGIMAAVEAVAVPAGAVLAGGIVAGFGAGIAGIGLKFAAESEVVKSIWSKTAHDLGAQMRLISKPFELTFAGLSVVARRTFAGLKPELAGAFKTLGPAVTQFGDSLGRAFEKLGPALQPLAGAFKGVLGALGPAMNSMFSTLSSNLTKLSESVSKNPTALADFVRGIGGLTGDLVGLVTDLNNADAAFKRLYGISAVTAFMGTLRGAVQLVVGPIDLLSQGFSKLGDGIRWAIDRQFPGQAQAAAASSAALASSLAAAAAAAKAHGEHLAHVNSVTHAASVQAYLLATAFQRQSDATTASNNALLVHANLLLGDKNAQVDEAQALLTAQQGITGSSAQLARARNTAATAAGRVTLAEAQLNALRQKSGATSTQILAAELRLAAAKRTAGTATSALNNAQAANTKTIDLNTQAGIDNQRNLYAYAARINATTTAMRSNNDGNVAAAKHAEQARQGFIKLAEQMGFTAPVAIQMARTMVAIPNVKRTATLDADPSLLQRKVAAAQAQIDHMHGIVVPITYTMNGVNYTLNTKAPSRVGGLAGGGPIQGPGSNTSDKAGLFALSNNEYVVKASSAQGYGPKAMNSINNGTATIIPGMAAGGAVDIHGTGVFKSVAQMQKILGQSLPAMSSAGAGAGVQKWKAVALAALAAAHEPAAWLGSLLRRMNQESGGNPRAINLWDSNAKAGTPSIGLMQTIGPTFSAYAGSYAGRGIYDPFANIYAAIKYTVSRYGSGPAGWDRPGGYKNGGWLMPGQTAVNETRKPEAIFNESQLAAMKQSTAPGRASGAAAVGGDVAAGLAKGMLGGGSTAINAAGQVAAAMIAKAREVLGIASPSKVFAQIGLYINQGFSIGLRGSAKQVQSAMSSLMSKVLNISFNAADTKKALQATISNLNASLDAARNRIKPVTGNSKQRASIERGNRQAEASIRQIQAKLTAARTDLANVDAIANRLGTTVKRNAIIGMLNRENAAMQKIANARAAVANQLKAAQAKLATAIQVRDDFKKQITDAALSFNSITNVQAPTDGPLTASGITAQMTETLRKTQAFAANLARLKKSGLNSTTYEQIASAGVDQGGVLADALLSGGGNTFNSINRLQSNISSAAAGLGDTASKNLYQAGVNAAQGLVNGLLAKTKALDAASKKLADAIVAQIKKTLGIHSPSKVMEWHGSMAGRGFQLGIEGEYGRVTKAGAGLADAAVPGASGRRGGVPAGSGGGNVYITVNGSVDPNGTALQILQLLKRYARSGGNVAIV